MKEKQKKQWRIPCTWSVMGTAVVEADTLEEAIEIVQDPDFPLPEDEGYVSESFGVSGDEDYIRDFYNDEQEDNEE